MSSIKEKNTEQGNQQEKGGNVHRGHRERFRQRFLKDGIESFSFHEKIEFLLFYAKPQVNTNEEAHILANAFDDSIVDIFEADISVLTKDIVSTNVAIFIKFLHELIKMYNMEKISRSNTTRGTLEELKGHLIVKYTGVTDETVRLISLNGRTEVLSDDIIHVGDVNSSFVNAGKIARIAFANNASGIVLAHNHPDGMPVPSPEDIMTTKHLREIMSDINLNFIEHYLIADNQIREISHYL